MNIFNNYADYYDLLYQDKNYQLESDYLYSLIKKYSKNSKSILELGCGTGKHAIYLSKKGYEITGVDLSQKMIDEAKIRLKLEKYLYENVDFYVQDIRNLNINKTFDVVLSLFHVISYLTTNNDLVRVFNNISEHLKKGGLFIFDCWYGPAVLTLRPATKVKKLENDKFLLTRIAEPKQNFNENIVNINYQVYVQDKISKNIDQFKETHKMRYLFRPEIEILLEKSNLELLHFEEWLTGNNADNNTWGVCFICRKA